jgi:hypothetical protein
MAGPAALDIEAWSNEDFAATVQLVDEAGGAYELADVPLRCEVRAAPGAPLVFRLSTGNRRLQSLGDGKIKVAMRRQSLTFPPGCYVQDLLAGIGLSAVRLWTGTFSLRTGVTEWPD